MSKLTDLFAKVVRHINKYYVAIIVFVIFTFFIGDSTLYKRYMYDKKIVDLKREIEFYKKEKEENTTKLQALHSDNETLERFAREQYLMTKPDEELFIIIP